MRKVGFQTLGCKVNIYESNALKNELIAKGYEIVEPSSDCDVFIVNTCSVTNMADAKSRKIIKRMRKLNLDAILCVMGCYSQTNPEAKELEGIDILVGNGNKKDVISYIEDKLLDKSIEKQVKILDILNTYEYEKLEVTTYDHSRAFVKIQDGCENFCTYCIIPYARGPIRSKPADDVIDELKRVTEEGYLEVVLAGIHTGKYKDGDFNLTSLIKRILTEVPKLKRLRLSSIEINEIDDEFIELMKNSNILANHLHLPLQSGSDIVLSKMERKYNTDFFIERINKIKQVRPDISISTDVIVGFPYETDEEYLNSKEFIKKVNFSKIHVFPYSKRRGTKAVLMPQVEDIVKKKRALDLINLSTELEFNYAQSFIDKTVSVLIEKKLDDNYMIGHSSNYLNVIVPINENYIKKIVDVKIEKVESDKVYGKIINI